MMEQYQDLVPNIVYFVDRRCFPEWEIVKQTIHFHDLTFIVEGKGVYHVNGKPHPVEAGDLIYIPEGSIREAHTSIDEPIHSYAFNFVWHHPERGVRLPFDAVTKQLVTNEVLHLIKEFTHVWMSKQPGYKLYARGLFDLILHRILSAYFHRSGGSLSDPRIDKAKQYIIDHYAEELDIAAVAQIVNLHPVYLGKLFKKTTSYSFREFLNLIRVNHAEMMLSTGGFSVSEAAQRCGFNDVSYFSNVFKSIKGCPPSSVPKM